MKQVRLFFSAVHCYGQKYLIDNKHITHSFVGYLLFPIIGNNKNVIYQIKRFVNFIAISVEPRRFIEGKKNINLEIKY